MNKITDADYYLPNIFAVSFLAEASTGETLPVIIRGVDERTHDESGEYFVKPIAAERMSANASMFELLAAFMAKQLGLNVAEPALINISPEFAELCKGKTYFFRIQKSIGINFGTRNFGGGFITWLPETHLPFNLEEEALKIFVFDLLIQNADRGHQKANINTNGKELKIFDHELAFSYTTLIGIPIAQEWRLDEKGFERDLIFKHVFYKYLKRKPNLPIDRAVESIGVLNEAFWQQAENLIPTQWMNSNFEKIKQHTQSIVTNINNFKKEIRRILS